jgi:dipeptidyl-peptidase-4
MPGFARFQSVGREIGGSVKSGAVNATWDADSKGFRYQRDGRLWRFDLATRKATEIPDATGTPVGRRSGLPERGRQFEFAMSPDSTRRAFHKERNVWIGDAKGENAIAITTDGNEQTRTKNGSASWVYGEELNQNTAMWWSPDGTKLAFYRFDEAPVPDFYLQLSQTKLQSTLDVEAYPKAGAPNPVVELFVYDTATRQTQRIDVRDGKPFTNDVVGHYVPRRWSPDGARSRSTAPTAGRHSEFTACSPRPRLPHRRP